MLNFKRLLVRISYILTTLLAWTSVGHADVATCDQLTSSYHDKAAQAPAVEYKRLRTHAVTAIVVCAAAIQEEPENARLKYQLGRSFLAAGQDTDAALWIGRAAESGYAVALNAYAVLLNHGRADGKDRSQIVELLKAAAAKGNVPAMANLGSMLNNIATHSSSSVVDRKASIEWLHRAAEENDPLALARLGWNYGMGDAGVTKNKELSYGFIERALALDEESAHYIALVVMASGFNDWEASEKLKHKFVHSKNRLVLLKINNWQFTKELIERFTELGFRFEREDEEPVYVKEFIFDSNYYLAQNMEPFLSQMNASTRQAAEVFIEEAFKKRELENPLPEANTSGVVPSKDFGKDSDCDLLASSQHDELAVRPAVVFSDLRAYSQSIVDTCHGIVTQSENNIRAKYLLGRSLIAAGRNEEAAKWFLEAAEFGYPAAMNAYGVLLNHGRGVEIDYEQSFKWLKKAAEAGNGAAAINLATAYFMGVGTELNASYGTHWTKVGAERKDPKSLFTLGGGHVATPIWYRNVAVRRDGKKGAALLHEAFQLGDIDAAYALYTISGEQYFEEMRTKLGLKSGQEYFDIALKTGDRRAYLRTQMDKIDSTESFVNLIRELMNRPHPIDRADQEPIYVLDAYMDNDHVLGELLFAISHGNPYHIGENEEVTEIHRILSDSNRSFERDLR